MSVTLRSIQNQVIAILERDLTDDTRIHADPPLTLGDLRTTIYPNLQEKLETFLRTMRS